MIDEYHLNTPAVGQPSADVSLVLLVPDRRVPVPASEPSSVRAELIDAVEHDYRSAQPRGHAWVWLRPALLGLLVVSLGLGASYVGFGLPPYVWQQQQVTLANATINQQNQEIAVDRQQVDSLRGSLADETQKNADLQRQVADLQAQVSDLNSQLGAARQQLQAAQSDANAAQSKASAAQSAAQQANAAAAAQAAKCHNIIVFKVCT